MNGAGPIGPEIPDEEIPSILEVSDVRGVPVFAAIPASFVRECPATWSALVTAIILHFLKSVKKRDTGLILTPQVREQWGIQRNPCYEGLRALEEAGLIEVTRGTCKSPTVAFLDPHQSTLSDYTYTNEELALLPSVADKVIPKRKAIPHVCKMCGDTYRTDTYRPVRSDSKSSCPKCRKRASRAKKASAPVPTLLAATATIAPTVQSAGVSQPAQAVHEAASPAPEILVTVPAVTLRNVATIEEVPAVQPGVRLCEICKIPLPEGSRRTKKHCGPVCRNKAWMAREKAAGRTRVFKRKTSAGIDKEPVQVKDTL